MHKEAAIELRKFKRICPFSGYKEESIKFGSAVVIQTDRGIEFGRIVEARKKIHPDVHLKKILRYATLEDLEKERSLPEKEAQFLATAVQKAKEHELAILIIDVEYLFDNSKAIIYFKTSSGDKSVNVRDLGRDISTTLKIRVELRQISPRDEAKLFGGIGACGRELCCCTWLEKPKHVTVKMAKEQGFAISPTKTSGMCGRLMCCLEYEYQAKAKTSEEKKGGKQ
jgi:cell fate regulator YaaT (PSP1 superfamily)